MYFIDMNPVLHSATLRSMILLYNCYLILWSNKAQHMINIFLDLKIQNYNYYSICLQYFPLDIFLASNVFLAFSAFSDFQEKIIFY